MAEARKPKRRIKPSTTVRENVQKSSKKTGKPKRTSAAVTRVRKPLAKANEFRKREYYLPLPDNKVGRFLNKRRRFIPSYFRNAFKEIRQVVWPNRKETTQLTVAVFIFAIIFGFLVTVTDYGLDKLFKKVLIK